MNLFNYDQVKDIQTTWKNSDERDKEACVKELATKYDCESELINRVIDGDKNVTSYSYIKSVRGAKAFDIKSLAEEAVEEYKETVEKDEEELVVSGTGTTEVVPEEEKPKNKGGWPKGKPRKKIEDTDCILGSLSGQDITTILEALKDQFKSLESDIERFNKYIEKLEKRKSDIQEAITKLEKYVE